MTASATKATVQQVYVDGADIRAAQISDEDALFAAIRRLVMSGKVFLHVHKRSRFSSREWNERLSLVRLALRWPQLLEFHDAAYLDVRVETPCH